MSRSNRRKHKSNSGTRGFEIQRAACAVRAEEIHRQVVRLRGQGEFQAAADLLEQCLNLRETSAAWREWAFLQLALQEVAEAEKGLRRALKLNPRDTLASANLSLVLKLLGRCGEADCTATSCQVDGSNQQRAVGSLMLLLGKKKPILDQFLEDIRTIPGESPSLAPALIEALRTTRLDSAYFVEKCLKRLDEIPADALPQALGTLAHQAGRDYRLSIVLARSAMQAEDYGTALRHLRSACDRCPSDLFAENTLIACSRQQASKTGAHSQFEGLEAYLAASFCDTPWRHLEIAWDGHAFLCCPAWLPLRVGNVQKEALEEIWNSAFAFEIRKSLLDGSFRFCSKIHCPRIAARTLPRRADVACAAVDHGAAPPPGRLPELNPAAFPIRVPYGPKTLSLSYDASCNLACPQCRKDFRMAGREEQQNMERTYLPSILRAARDAEILYLDGSGELLASRHSRHLLSLLTREQFPQLKFLLISNGQLLNERAFRDLDLYGRVSEIQVSVDAARPETYRFVRRGGDFDRLLANLAFLDDLRSFHGETFRLELRFVVSSMNFREMPEFVRLGKRFHADSVLFTIVRNWWDPSLAEVEKLNVASPCHFEHEEFLKVLESPELSDPVVDLGSVAPYRLAQARRDE